MKWPQCRFRFYGVRNSKKHFRNCCCLGQAELIEINEWNWWMVLYGWWFMCGCGEDRLLLRLQIIVVINTQEWISLFCSLLLPMNIKGIMLNTKELSIILIKLYRESLRKIFCFPYSRIKLRKIKTDYLMYTKYSPFKRALN